VDNDSIDSIPDDMIDLNHINLQDQSDSKIAFRKYPFAMWIVGLLIFILATYCFFHVVLTAAGTDMPGYKDQHWWQWLVVLGMYILSFVFLLAGKVESVVFDKSDNKFSRIKTNIF